MSIGRLQRVPQREIWAHEAQNFTTQIQGNMIDAMARLEKAFRQPIKEL